MVFVKKEVNWIVNEVKVEVKYLINFVELEMLNIGNWVKSILNEVEVLKVEVFEIYCELEECLIKLICFE